MDELRKLWDALEASDGETVGQILGLDPPRVQTWFEGGFPEDDYGVEIRNRIGTYVVEQLRARAQTTEPAETGPGRF